GADPVAGHPSDLVRWSFHGLVQVPDLAGIHVLPTGQAGGGSVHPPSQSPGVHAAGARGDNAVMKPADLPARERDIALAVVESLRAVMDEARTDTTAWLEWSQA